MTEISPEELDALILQFDAILQEPTINQYLEQDFFIWKAGASKVDVMSWFDQQCERYGFRFVDRLLELMYEEQHRAPFKGSSAQWKELFALMRMIKEAFEAEHFRIQALEWYDSRDLDTTYPDIKIVLDINPQRVTEGFPLVYSDESMDGEVPQSEVVACGLQKIYVLAEGGRNIDDTISHYVELYLVLPQHLQQIRIDALRELFRKLHAGVSRKERKEKQK